MHTLEGTKRFLITRTTTDTPDTFEALPKEFRETISEVHFADGSNEDLLGMEGTYGIDLDEEFEAKVRKASNLIDLTLVDPGRLGRWSSREDDGFEDLAEYVEPVEIPDELDPIEGARRERFWKIGPVTDQGREGACVGHAGISFLTNSPIRTYAAQPTSKLNTRAYNLYKELQRKWDEWAGENYSGTSVSALLKWMQHEGHIERAAVTSSMDTMISWKLSRGALILSMPWFEGCYRTDSRGFLRPTGRKVGGHALIDIGVSKWMTGYLKNSWGLGFGIRGIGYVAINDYRHWMKLGGRAYTAVETRRK